MDTRQAKIINWILLVAIVLTSAFMIRAFANTVASQREAQADYIIDMNNNMADALINARGKSVSNVLADAVLRTSKGEITLEFLPTLAPNTVANFMKLAKDGFYDGTKFHRVIKDFMIQGGDPLTKTDATYAYGTGGPGYKFDDEISNKKFEPGIVAMANTGPNSNGSQFFIVTGKNVDWLQGKYTIFAKVIKGMDVVHAIEKVKTDERDMPLSPVTLDKAITRY